MKTVLYFYPNYSSFVASDQQLLARHFRVKSFLFKPAYKFLTPLSFLLQFIFLLQYFRPGVLMVSQFSGYHTVLPSLFKSIFHRPHYIILHGTECNNFPEYHYGFKSRPVLNLFSKVSLSLSTRLLPVSEALVFQKYTFMPTRYSSQGLKAFYPGLKTPVTIIPNGVAPDVFILDQAQVRTPSSFVTVATGLEDSNRRSIKGLDFISEVAALCPDFHFTFIGGRLHEGESLPSNITLIEYVPNQELVHLYNQHCFYLQWSVSEGFGISLVEAMMCGCVPVVSRVGVMPEIAGPNGYILETKNPDSAVKLLREAVDKYHGGHAAEIRRWVTDRYSLEQREKALVAVIHAGL